MTRLRPMKSQKKIEKSIIMPRLQDRDLGLLLLRKNQNSTTMDARGSMVAASTWKLLK
jgi:hypothetical protein